MLKGQLLTDTGFCLLDQELIDFFNDSIFSLSSFFNSSHFHLSLPADPPSHPGPTFARRIVGGAIPQRLSTVSTRWSAGGIKTENIKMKWLLTANYSCNLVKAATSYQTAEGEEDDLG